MDATTRRLPGVVPIAPEDWLIVDDAYAGQMALRDRLAAAARDRVIAQEKGAAPAANALLAFVLERLGHKGAEAVRRADGVVVPICHDDPMGTLCRLVAEDLCLMDRRENAEHVLVAAALCFPSGWRLDQKIGRPMAAIHGPVARYNTDVARRVQRLLDGVRPQRGLLRGTAHWSGAPLHNPLPEADRRAPGPAPFIRVERQCLFRLPMTGAVVFSIHTSLVRPEVLTPEQATALAAYPIGVSA